MSTAPSPASLNRLWLAISSHGHGHLVQVTPLIRALRDRNPSLALAVQSDLPAALLRQTLGEPLELIADPGDVGMVMDGPMTVLPEDSLQAYQRFQASRKQRLARQMTLYQAFAPDLVVSDVPYLPLVAAQQRQIPAVAVCSLNWADILEHYCANLPGAQDIVDSIRADYAAADLFLRPAPSMPMSTLANTVAIGPLISVESAQRNRLEATLSLSSGTAQRIVLVTLGGIPGMVDIARWQAFDNTVFLVPKAWLEQRDDTVRVAKQFRTIESTGLSFAELFASCNALITKPGYGAFAGAGCVGLPVLYAKRGDWPEEPYLIDWLQSVGRASAIDMERLVSGEFSDELNTLLAQAPRPPVEATGAAEGVRQIDTLLSR